MIRVDSSSIDSVGYAWLHDHNGGELYVKFSSGKCYTYVGVPRIVYLGLLAAKSTGQYFTEFVKGRYDNNGPDAEQIV